MSVTQGDGVTFGDVEAKTRVAVTQLGSLSGIQGALAQIAYRLARALDGDMGGMAISATAKELRETLTSMKEAANAGNAASDLETYLSTAVGDAEDPEPADARS